MFHDAFESSIYNAHTASPGGWSQWLLLEALDPGQSLGLETVTTIFLLPRLSPWKAQLIPSINYDQISVFVTQPPGRRAVA